MLHNLAHDKNLRGYVFEYIARILLRRERKNNFIFLLNRFDSVEESITKYRFDISSFAHLLTRLNDCRCDIIEFRCSDKKSRHVQEIALYDVKTKHHLAPPRPYDACLSNHKFMKMMGNLLKTYLISVMVFDDWRFSFNIYDYQTCKFRIYDSQINHNRAHAMAR